LKLKRDLVAVYDRRGSLAPPELRNRERELAEIVESANRAKLALMEISSALDELAPLLRDFRHRTGPEVPRRRRRRSAAPAIPTLHPGGEGPTALPPEAYSGRKIAAWWFEDGRHPTGSWMSTILEICTILAARGADEFSRAATQTGHPLDLDPRQLNDPKPIPGTSAFVDATTNTPRKVETIYRLLAALGYPQGTVRFETS
jgi:hypothetical protein